MVVATSTKLQNFIDGEWADPAEGQTEPTVNPATAEEIAQVPLSGAEDVDRAVSAARRAFERSIGVVSPHVSNAFRAAATARSTSSAVDSGAWAIVSPVAGFSTGSVCPSAGSTNSPSMKF